MPPRAQDPDAILCSWEIASILTTRLVICSWTQTQHYAALCSIRLYHCCDRSGRCGAGRRAGSAVGLHESKAPSAGQCAAEGGAGDGARLHRRGSHHSGAPAQLQNLAWRFERRFRSIRPLRGTGGRGDLWFSVGRAGCSKKLFAKALVAIAKDHFEFPTAGEQGFTPKGGLAAFGANPAPSLRCFAFWMRACEVFQQLLRDIHPDSLVVLERKRIRVSSRCIQSCAYTYAQTSCQNSLCMQRKIGTHIHISYIIYQRYSKIKYHISNIRYHLYRCMTYCDFYRF